MDTAFRPIGDGYGYGSGSGDGSGYGYGDGDGDGYGYGYGYGYGFGYGTVSANPRTIRAAVVDEYSAKNGYQRMCPTCGREQ